MTALIIVGAILLFLTFLLLQWVKIIIEYKDTVSYKIYLSLIPINIEKFTKRKKKKKQKKKAKPTKEAAPTAEKQKKDSSPGAGDILGVLDVVREILPKFAGRLHIKTAKLKAVIAGEDAASTAIKCGAVKAAAALLFEFIDRNCRLNKKSIQNISIEPNFISNETDLDIKLIFKIRICGLLALGASFLIKFIKRKIKEETKQTKKGKTT